MRKIRSILGILLGCVLAHSTVYADFAGEFETAQKEAQALLRQADTFAERDPQFQQWLTWQRPIVEQLCRNIAADEKTLPEMAASELADLQYWVRRVNEEVEFFTATPDLTANGSLNVRDFGAAGDGIQDDGPALRAAIAAAAEGEIRTVFLPKGQYRIVNPGASKRATPQQEGIPAYEGFQAERGLQNANLMIEGRKDLLILGEEGTELLCPRALDSAILVVDCNNVQIRNLKITYAQKAYTTGEIVAIVDDNNFDLKLDAGMTDPTQSYFTEAQFKGMFRVYSQERLPNSLRPAASSVSAHSVAPGVQHLQDDIYRFTIKDFTPVPKYYKVGHRIAYYARTYGNHCVINESSDRTRFENITINSSSAMAFLNNNSDMMFIVGCKVEAEPGSWVSSAADGIYFRDVMLGGLIAGNTVRHIGDDFVNIHNILYPALEQENNTLYFHPASFPAKRLKRAQRLGWIRTKAGAVDFAREFAIQDYRIVERNGEARLAVTVAGEVPETATIGNTPEGLPDMFVLAETQANGNVLVDNRFEHGLSRFLMGGRNWIMAENHIEDSLNHPRFFNVGQERGTSRDGGEGEQPRNITFVNNHFNILGKTLFSFCDNFAADAPNAGPLTAHLTFAGNECVLYGGGEFPIFDAVRTYDLNIRDNRFIFRNGYRVPFLKAANSDRIDVTGNRVEGAVSTWYVDAGGNRDIHFDGNVEQP